MLVDVAAENHQRYEGAIQDNHTKKLKGENIMHMNFKKGLALLACSASLFLAVNLATAADLTYASGLPPSHPTNEAGIVPSIEKLKPEINMTFTGGGQLFKLSEALKSVGSGVSDLTLVLPAYHASELPHAAIPFNLLLLTRNELAAAGATADTFFNDCPECLKDYARSNALSLGNMAIGGYSLMCREKVNSLDDIKGKRIRVTGSLGRWAEYLGGVPVSMTSADMVESLQRGVLDCVMGFTAWYQAFPIADSIKGIYSYNIGATGAVSLVTVNRESWDNMTDEDKRKLWNTVPNMISSAMIPGYIKQDIQARRKAKEAGVAMVDGASEVTPLWDGYKQSEIDTVNANAKKLGVENAPAITSAYLANYAKWLTLIEDAGLSEMHAGGPLFSDEELEAARKKFEDLLHKEIYDKIDPTSL